MTQDIASAQWNLIHYYWTQLGGLLRLFNTESGSVGLLLDLTRTVQVYRALTQRQGKTRKQTRKKTHVNTVKEIGREWEWSR